MKKHARRGIPRLCLDSGPGAHRRTQFEEGMQP
jgi:hypothetical protein